MILTSCLSESLFERWLSGQDLGLVTLVFLVALQVRASVMDSSVVSGRAGRTALSVGSSFDAGTTVRAGHKLCFMCSFEVCKRAKGNMRTVVLHGMLLLFLVEAFVATILVDRPRAPVRRRVRTARLQGFLVIDVLALVQLQSCVQVMGDIVAGFVPLFPVLDLLRGILVFGVITVVALLGHEPRFSKERAWPLS